MQNTLPSGLCTSFLLIADLWQQLGGEFHKEECCQETVRLMFFEQGVALGEYYTGQSSVFLTTPLNKELWKEFIF